MKTRERVTVLNALRAAEDLILADQQVHARSYTDARTGLIFPVTERARARAYTRALRRIEKALGIVEALS